MPNFSKCLAECKEEPTCCCCDHFCTKYTPSDTDYHGDWSEYCEITSNIAWEDDKVCNKFKCEECNIGV